MGQIRVFFRSDSVHFGSVSQNVLNLIWKYSRIYPICGPTWPTFGSNLYPVFKSYLSLLLLVAGQNPEIVDNIYPDVQRVGGTARLNCTVARLGDDDQHSVQWSFNGTRVISINTKVNVLNPSKGDLLQVVWLFTIKKRNLNINPYTFDIDQGDFSITAKIYCVP